MGVFEQRRGEFPGEIVEVYRRPVPIPGREPGEIIEVYRQRDRREVVEQYRRTLPAHTAEPAQEPDLLTDLFPPPRKTENRPLERSALQAAEKPSAAMIPLRQRRRRKTGLRMFLFFVVTAVLTTVGVRLMEDVAPQEMRDPFEHYGWEDEGPVEDLADKRITIPSWPTGQGVELTVLREHGGALTPQEVYRQVNPSVVTVMVGISGNKMSVGTGVIFTGDAENDLAILKVEPGELRDLGALPAAAFGDSDLLSVGDPVYAIGNPLGWELRGTLTDGIVSAINRGVEVDGRIMTLIQTNAALNSGNSGGPLINEYGQVVGINVIKMSSDYSTVEGLGFAIPSALMNRMVNDLLAWGEIKPEPQLGVTVLRTGEQLADGVWGLEVREVEKYSAADLAGMEAGDFLLTADGETLYTIQDLMRVRRRFHVGDQLPVTFWRDGKTMEAVLNLENVVDE